MDDAGVCRGRPSAIHKRQICKFAKSFFVFLVRLSNYLTSAHGFHNKKTLTTHWQTFLHFFFATNCFFPYFVSPIHSSCSDGLPVKLICDSFHGSGRPHNGLIWYRSDISQSNLWLNNTLIQCVPIEITNLSPDITSILLFHSIPENCK